MKGHEIRGGEIFIHKEYDDGSILVNKKEFKYYPKEVVKRAGIPKWAVCVKPQRKGDVLTLGGKKFKSEPIDW